MANSFPAPPSGWQLAQVSYQATLPQPELQVGAALNFGAGVTTYLSYSVPVLGLVFAFGTPGTTGNFDQSAVEGALANAVTAVCQVLSNMSGVALATVQAGVVISRTWEWRTPAGDAINTSDTVSYP